MKTFSKILVPVDFSSYASEAIQYAAELSKRYQAPVTLAHVYQSSQYAMPEGFGAYAPDFLARVLTELKKHTDTARMAAEAAGALQPEARVVQGDVSSEIVKLANEGGYDLIVMGTHGRTGASHLLMGSIAEKVVRRARCPVLTVRPTQREAFEA